MKSFSIQVKVVINSIKESTGSPIEFGLINPSIKIFIFFELILNTQ